MLHYIIFPLILFSLCDASYKVRILDRVTRGESGGSAELTCLHEYGSRVPMVWMKLNVEDRERDFPVTVGPVVLGGRGPNHRYHITWKSVSQKNNGIRTRLPVRSACARTVEMKFSLIDCDRYKNP